MSNTLMQQFVKGLKSRSDETRKKAARDLLQYLKTELREVSAEEQASFMDEFNDHIFEMVSGSQDVNEKKGGILAIVCLIEADVGNITNRIGRFANYLRNLLPSSDTGVMELAAHTVGMLALVSGTYAAEYFEFEVKRAFEWLGGDRNEGKRFAAVLVLRKLALCVPTYFFQQVQTFFDLIFNAVRDPKPAIREGAVDALRAALIATSQREMAKQAQKPTWYKQCFDEVLKGFEDAPTRERGTNREDRIHGSLLVLNELFRCSNATWERKYISLMEKVQSQPEAKTEECVDLVTLQRKTPVGSKSPLGPHRESVPAASIIYESAACRQLIMERFDDICHYFVQAQHFARNSYLQHSLLTILPRLAAFNREKFTRDHLHSSIIYLLNTLRSREKDRSTAFTAMGLLAVAVEDDIKEYIPKIMEVIRASLPTKDTPNKKRFAPLEPAVLVCISLIGEAVGSDLHKDIRDILEPLWSTGLSAALDTCLRNLAVSVPQLKREISEGMLRMLSQVLMHKQLRHPGMPRHLSLSGGGTSSNLPPPYNLNSPEGYDTQSIVLALRTLGSFNFDGYSLLQFVRRCADHFLTSEQQEIRLETVCTCSRCLKLALESCGKRPSDSLRDTVAEVIRKLLIVGITDTDADVRYWVLASLDYSFDIHLAQAENLSALFVSMNDEVFEIRELAICTIGRLCSLNPAYAMPALRKTLMQFLTELEYSGMGRNKEQSARMLDHLVVHAPCLIEPYMEPVLKVLVPKLREVDLNPGVVVSILRCIGDLAEVSGSDMMPWMDELLAILLDMLGDSSSSEKRGIALWVLGRLVSSTGFVVRPYNEYPQLLEVLTNFLKTEQQSNNRRETIRVLGLLGALDPYKHKMNLGQIDSQIDSTALLAMTDVKGELDASHELTTSEMLVNMSSATLEEYYPAVAIATLMRIIRDPTLSQHHTMVVQAVTFIFKSLGIKCVPYIAQVMPSFLNVIRSAEMGFKEFLFQQLAVLIAIVKQHIRNYLDDIFVLIREFWTTNSPLQGTLILLVEHIAVALGAEFKVYLPQLMPQIMRVLCHDNSKDRNVTNKLLVALQKFGNSLDEYLHLVLPPMVRLFDATDCPQQVCRAAMESIEHLAESLDFTDSASRIVHPLVRTLDTHPELRQTAMDTLCALILQLERKFTIFIPLVSKMVLKHKISCPRYEALTSKLLNGQPLADEENLQSKHKQSRIKNRDLALTSSDTTTIKRLHVSAPNLQQAWTATRRVSKDDWLEWLRRLSIGLLKESPSPALRSCLALAQTYSQLPRDLFNAAFVSCWSELDESYQKELIQALQQALMVPDLPEITQTILNLAEFMEHCDKGPLPLDPHLLGERAMQCRAYAKALHYKEEEFHAVPNAQVIESLISINNKLQQKEAAAGLLEYVMNHHGKEFKVQERWYEKLHNWEKALDSYKERSAESSNDLDLVLGQMRCMEALGEWGQLQDLAECHWTKVTEDARQRMSRMACAAAWGLRNWESMDRYVNCVPRDTQDGTFYRAVLAVHREQYDAAMQLIESARDLVDTELTAMAGESYQRAYGAMVSVQMLAELEEVIQYKLNSDRRETIRKMWWERLQGCQRVVEDWQRIIQVHSLVVSPEEDMHTWLKYASLCRKSSRFMLSKKTLVMLLGVDPDNTPNDPLPTACPQVTFAFAKHMWMSGRQVEAYNRLHNFVLTSLQPEIEGAGDKRDEHCRLLARCYLKLGQWQEALQGLSEHSIPDVLKYYQLAREHDPQWYKAWHAWAYVNFETVLFYKQNETPSGGSSGSTTANNYISKFTVPAVVGFFRSISLSHGSSLQDTLRLLTLWFDYGQWPEVYDAIVEGLRTVQINTWLQVIPQLIARIDTPRVLVGRLIHHLLMDIGKHHPQALVYPLTVASKSASTPRRVAANKILKSMCEHSQTLVQQAVMVSDELIRVAILWHELWHEGLEEASRLYFGEHNVKGMFEALDPLHAMLERGPQTLKETSFNQAYSRDLMEAQDWCQRYKVSGNVRDLNQAWDLYYHVFRRISRQLPQLTSLELQYVSPKLLVSRDLELAVPGSYVPGQPVVRIAHIQSSLHVITSKQRPRKLCIRGSNGNDYMFLLKGHEDLRQDERVMQLFGLVNTILINDPETYRRNLTIQRYAVIPLSTNSGLIGWVPHCDTLHTLIRDFREKKKILLNIEHRIMLRMAQDYEHLTLMQKVEVFEHALEHTQGDDLARLLWLKSPSSEVWFDRRTNYTRSLAVMSMVGYILGLGDRHPSNLMLDRLSGKILHIDFGDCFEVAMTREKFPEKIPFRLTRMLINAMEVTGIEGTYRRTCESVMSVLHRNKDSLMAVLEAFVYDPLLNWRLIDGQNAQVNRKIKGGPDVDSVPSSTSSQEHGDLAESIGAAPTSLSTTLPKRALQALTNTDINAAEINQPEALNKKALAIITRVREKLTGRDFSHEEETVTVQRQVELLIKQATSNENLCQCYIGWCPFW
ncbi:Serine/threonine-protein kinase mTOR [Frankliniella fusca]|uniref:Serine/threonine-protein kinase TOR n=1 Tax=Frankliniella fusca TaxID=407009 RepID=A0AAE1HNE0_9NEOP|nr:Serine/threonine-protein kinase mTOR [Frankliniella fusca]